MRKLGRVQTQTSLLVAGEMKKELSLTYRHYRRKPHVGVQVAKSRHSSDLANQAINLFTGA